jgi:hypothetical protein
MLAMLAIAGFEADDTFLGPVGANGGGFQWSFQLGIEVAA